MWLSKIMRIQHSAASYTHSTYVCNFNLMRYEELIKYYYAEKYTLAVVVSQIFVFLSFGVYDRLLT